MRLGWRIVRFKTWYSPHCYANAKYVYSIVFDPSHLKLHHPGNTDSWNSGILSSKRKRDNMLFEYVLTVLSKENKQVSGHWACLNTHLLCCFCSSENQNLWAVNHNGNKLTPWLDLPTLDRRINLMLPEKKKCKTINHNKNQSCYMRHTDRSVQWSLQQACLLLLPCGKQVVSLKCKTETHCNIVFSTEG